MSLSELNVTPTATLQSLSEKPSKEGVQSQTISEVFEQTPQQKRRAFIQLSALSVVLFNLGWNDGTPGPLLPRLQSVYHVGYAVVSLVFVLSCTGFITGALINIWLTDRFGLGKIMTFGVALQIIAYSVQTAAPPFPAFVAMNFLNGMGLAFQDAHASGFVGASATNVETKMGFVQSFYGFGAFASSLISTQFSQQERWSFHYLVSLGLSIISAALILAVFGFKTQEECLKESGQYNPQDAEGSTTFRGILSNPTVHCLAFFLFTYVGLEITLGGWITTFIIEARDGGPESGYIATGYFAALAVSRVVFLPINAFLGENIAVILYSLLTLGLEFTVWFVPSLIGNGISMAFIGLFLGPLYPLAMNHASRYLPRHILTGSVGWIAAFGQAGSALLPFVAGAISGRWGIASLHPLAVVFIGLVIVLWGLTIWVSRKARKVQRTESTASSQLSSSEP